MKRILVIDDDAFTRAMIKGILDDPGYELVEAPDGTAGLKLLQEQPFDLVLLDVFMPGLDGFETLERMEDGGRKVPVIVMSGRGLSTGAFPLHLAMTMGADVTLNKGAIPEELAGKVREILARSASGVPGGGPS